MKTISSTGMLVFTFVLSVSTLVVVHRTPWTLFSHKAVNAALIKADSKR